MSRSVVKTSWWISLLLGVAYCLALPALGDPMVATPPVVQQRTFKVCMLLLQSESGTYVDPTSNASTSYSYDNADPWYFPVINRSAYLPAGWVLDNPLAPGVLANDPDLIASGFGYANSSKGGSNPGNNWYTLGSTFNAYNLTKDDPAYWVVKLSKQNVAALSSFDLLILNGHFPSVLSDQDRDNLQMLLDRGATIWVNNSQGQGYNLFNFFLTPYIQFHNGTSQQEGTQNYQDHNNPMISIIDPTSWLLNAVYPLNAQDVNYLRDSISECSYITRGVAGFDPGPAPSQIAAVVALTPWIESTKQLATSYEPCIAAGRAGDGELVATGTDIIGGTSDWWEFNHVNYGNTLWPISTLSTAPFNNTPPTLNQSQPLSYISCCKFFFNMLAHPVAWGMVGGNAQSSRFAPQAFSTSVRRDWTMPFTTLSDPVSFGDFVAVTGEVPEASSTSTNTLWQPELLVAHLNTLSFDPIINPINNTIENPLNALQPGDSAIDMKWNVALASGYCWIGSPVLGQILVNNVTENLVFAIEGKADPVQHTWTLIPCCWQILPTNTALAWTPLTPSWVGASIATSIPAPGVNPTIAALPAASLTISGNRLVLTVFNTATYSGAQPSSTTNDMIHILDAATGNTRAVVGASNGWGGGWVTNLRLTGPASIISARVNLLMTNNNQAGDASEVIVGATQQRQEQMELLAVTGAYLPNTLNASWQSVLLLIPPMFVVQRQQQPLPPGNTIPADFTFWHYTDFTSTLVSDQIGASTNPYRQANIVMMQTNGNLLKVVFRNWDLLDYPPSTGQSPYFTFSNGTQRLTGLQLSMGYPIMLQGQSHYNLNARYTLRASDDDGLTLGAYQVDAAPLVQANNIVVGTNTDPGNVGPSSTDQGKYDVPPLRSTGDPDTDTATARLATQVIKPGALTAYRITDPECAKMSMPGPFAIPDPTMTAKVGAWKGDIAWQFYGDTLGPNSVWQVLAYQNYAAYPPPAATAPPSALYHFPSWSPPPPLWTSDFPFPAAAGKNADYVTGLYNGYTRDISLRNDGGQYQAATAPSGALYALDPSPSRYLQQVAYVGAIPPLWDPGAAWTDLQKAPNHLTVNLNHVITSNNTYTTIDNAERDALRVGARVIVTETVTGTAADPYIVYQTTSPAYANDIGMGINSVVYDLGTVISVQKDTQSQSATKGMPIDPYIVTFDRPLPPNLVYTLAEVWKEEDPHRQPNDNTTPPLADAHNMSVRLQVATSTPYVSHVQRWDQTSGAEPVTNYQRMTNSSGALPVSEGDLSGNTTEMSTASHGICATYPTNLPANPDPSQTISQHAETMVAFSQLQSSSFAGMFADQSAPPAPEVTDVTAAPDGVSQLAAYWATLTYQYLPMVPLYSQQAPLGTAQQDPITKAVNIEYSVDYRSGRIALNPAMTGLYADRFVVVHYYTNDATGGATPGKVLHAEIMHVPAQILWEYQFPPVNVNGQSQPVFPVPDSGPVVVNNTVYLTVEQPLASGGWQPTLYAFTTSPTAPQQVTPISMQSLGPSIPYALAPNMLPYPVPYRAITSPAPTPNGLVLGTAAPGGSNPVAPAVNNVFALFIDRGVVVGDAHRLLHLNSDGQATWQASATKDVDPLVVANMNPASALGSATINASSLQQDFRQIARVHHFADDVSHTQLPNGDLLVCDTGGNRVVQLDRTGAVAWQYPDSDISFQEPDSTTLSVQVPNTTGTNNQYGVQVPAGLSTSTRQATPQVMRLSSPRDVRRYYVDFGAPVATTVKYGAETDIWTASLRWEITMITDTGNNRIIENYRPLLALNAITSKTVANNATPSTLLLAKGYRYRPGWTISYTDSTGHTYNLTLQQSAAVIADGATLGAAKPLAFTIAMRYGGKLNMDAPALADTTSDPYYPFMNGVYSAEVLAVVGNSVTDPGNPTSQLRTILLSRGSVTGMMSYLTPSDTLAVAASANAPAIQVTSLGRFRAGDLISINGVANGWVTGSNGYTLTLSTPVVANYAIGALVTAQRQPATTAGPSGLAPGTWNELYTRQSLTTKYYDYALVRQLDLLQVYNPSTALYETHALVVDQSGVREVNIADATLSNATIPFEINQNDYANALASFTNPISGGFYSGLSTQNQKIIQQWAQNQPIGSGANARAINPIFAPVSVMRIDGGNNVASDVRYLITQMSALPRQDVSAWVPDATGLANATPRTFLFEAHQILDPNASPTAPRITGSMIDADGSYCIYPDPLSPVYPNLAGTTYPLTQPLTIDRD